MVLSSSLPVKIHKKDNFRSAINRTDSYTTIGNPLIPMCDQDNCNLAVYQVEPTSLKKIELGEI